mmetsp:Transcript_1097/g.2341  ORF Transcript_1097/g.2341 Transcript_1097/m.2341 type:complete len:202 (-) Transcript_1097:165-770(-)
MDPALCASRGLDTVRRFDASRFMMYTSFCFSTAATSTALPFGSTARYSPGTARRHPVLPKVSDLTTLNAPPPPAPAAPGKGSNSRMVSLPLSLPTTTRSLVAPWRRKGLSERTTLNVGMAHTDTSFPVWSSGRRSSMVDPRATTNSCTLGAEKFPLIAQLIAPARWSESDKKCILLISSAYLSKGGRQFVRVSSSIGSPAG